MEHTLCGERGGYQCGRSARSAWERGWTRRRPEASMVRFPGGDFVTRAGRLPVTPAAGPLSEKEVRMELSLSTYGSGDHTVLEVGGEVDVYTAPRLRER